MSKRKKLFISFILILILVVNGFVTVLDFSRFFGLSFPHAYSSFLIKRIIVILATCLVWTAGKDRYDLIDNKEMKIIFIVICFAETALLLKKTTAGVTLFAVCQWLLIMRNGKGLKSKLIQANQKQKAGLRRLGLTIMLIPAVIMVLFYQVLKFDDLFFISCFYGVLLSTSLWVGLANHVLGIFPEKNAKMIGIGMMCFYFSDFLVAFNYVMKGGIVWLLMNSGIWIFYTAAMVLLALSCYKYE